MPQFKKGDAVRQVMPTPITGTVAGFLADQQTGVLQVCVAFSENGEERLRYFDIDQIEVVAEASA